MPARRLEHERLEDCPRCRADGVVLGVLAGLSRPALVDELLLLLLLPVLRHKLQDALRRAVARPPAVE